MTGPVFTTHRPNELMQEIRALWGALDRVSRLVSRAALAPAADPVIGPRVSVPDDLCAKSYFVPLVREGAGTTTVNALAISGAWVIGQCHVELVDASYPWPSYHYCTVRPRYSERSWDRLGALAPKTTLFHWSLATQDDLTPDPAIDSGLSAMPGTVDGNQQMRITCQMWDNGTRNVCYKALVWGWVVDHRVYNLVDACPLE